jgi:hypothetical protein
MIVVGLLAVSDSLPARATRRARLHGPSRSEAGSSLRHGHPPLGLLAGTDTLGAAANARMHARGPVETAP